MIENSEHKPIFVIGSARSGTSILGYAIRTGAEIVGSQEGHFLPLMRLLIKEIREYYERNHHLMGKKAFVLSKTEPNELEAQILEIFRHTCNSIYQNPIWVDKTPDFGMIESAPYLLRCWPQGRIVYAKRRGIECIMSRIRKFPNKSFEHQCNLWKKCIESWLKVREQLGDKYLEIEQREIALNPEETAQQLGDFLNFDAQQTQKIGEIFLTKRPESTGKKETDEAIDMAATGWSDEEIAVFRKICGEVNKKMGYSELSSYYL